MKFPADMGISPHTVCFLCNLGHEALHLHEQELDQMADPNIMEKGRQAGRISPGPGNCQAPLRRRPDDEDTLEFLDSVNTFNISTRYPDQKLRFYNLCTKDFAAENFARIKEIRKWLLQKIYQ